MAHKIAAASGPGTVALQVTNHSSLDDKSVREVRSALENELHVEGVHTAKAEQAMGTVEVVLSESLREYVWTAEIVIGSDEKKVAIVSLPRPTGNALHSRATHHSESDANFRAKTTNPRRRPGGRRGRISRPIVLGDGIVSIYRQQGTNPGGRWDLEISLPLAHSRTLPRDLRGRLLLRRDRLFDVYLPGTFCRSTSSATAPLAIACNDTDDPWPLTSYDDGVRGFFASSRNFFTGALSPGIGKISNVPAFYSAGEFQKSGYKLWAFAAVDGSLHLVDGMTDQAVRGWKWGSDLAAVHSGCGSGTQLLVSDSGNPERDALRAFEIPDRDPVAASSALEFEGQITALWPETNGNSTTAIVKRKDTGWYEAYRVSISCGN